MSVHPVADTDHEWRVQEGIALTTWIAPLSFCTGCRRDAARSRAAALDLRKRRPEMAEQFAHELSPAGLARSGAKRRWCRAPSLESHPARVARAAARRRHLGRGQPSVAPIEDQLISPALFAALREAGPLPVAAPATAESTSPSGARCWRGASPRSPLKRPPTGWTTCRSKAPN